MQLRLSTLLHQGKIYACRYLYHQVWIKAKNPFADARFESLQSLNIFDDVIWIFQLYPPISLQSNALYTDSQDSDSIPGRSMMA